MKDKRKTNKSNLENKRFLFLQFGFVIALAAVLFAFETKSYDAIEYDKFVTVAEAEEEVIINTTRDRPEPPKIEKIRTTVIEIITGDDPEFEDEGFEALANEEFGDFDPEKYFNPEDEKPAPEDDTFILVEEMPSYMGGEEARLRFLAANIKYPKMAVETHIEGKVYVQFIVEKDGSITNVKILRGIGGGCDEEALRVTKMMPRWKAGKQRNKPVRVKYNMPIKFTLRSN